MEYYTGLPTSTKNWYKVCQVSLFFLVLWGVKASASQIANQLRAVFFEPRSMSPPKQVCIPPWTKGFGIESCFCRSFGPKVTIVSFTAAFVSYMQRFLVKQCSIEETHKKKGGCFAFSEGQAELHTRVYTGSPKNLLYFLVWTVFLFVVCVASHSVWIASVFEIRAPALKKLLLCVSFLTNCCFTHSWNVEFM